MRKLQLRTLILGIILSVMILMGFPGNRLARAADPDFGTVTDILGGQRHLLRDDDLLVTADLPPTYGTVTLHTKDLQVINQIASTVVSNTCSMPFPAPRPRQTRIGRLFALPNDVIVTLAPTSTATGSGCNGNPNMAYYITDPQDPTHNTTHPLALSAFWVQIALADFNFDGYVDVFTINNQVAFVATAVNPNDPTQGLAAPTGAVLDLGSPYTPFTVPPLPDSSGPYPAMEMEGLAVGRFDPPATQTGQLSFNQQIAVLVQNPVGDDPLAPFLDLYTVNLPTSFTPVFASRYNIPGLPDPLENVYGQALAAGDAQGRSLLLGAPQRVTITSHIQPDIVLGIPPIHIDYIRDVNNLGPNGTPSVLNISVIPSLPAPATAFNTQYSFSSSSSTSASRKNTTSYAFSTKETAEAKVSYGIPDIASVSVDLKTAAQQTHDITVATAFNTYSGVTSNLSATTGFADHLFFTETRFNIYYYPVIGQTVCPAANPTCPDNEKLPLHVQFSGPDMVTLSDIDATTQEWYQPVWEPGNLFSYPWNLSLLQQAFPNLTPLTTNPAPWRGMDTSTSAYTTTWTAGSGSSQSSGSVNSTSIDVSVTVAAKAGIEGFGIDGSAGFEVNSSESVNTLNTSTQTLSASAGIQVNKPDFGDVVAENYLYDFGGYIFGQAPPTGTVQTIPLEDAQGNPIAIQATGPLTVGFVADPLREGLPWWLQAYTRPDVGLNHPARWNWSKSTQTASFNSANSEEPALDQSFYHIKGLFITPQDANGTGPQLTTATAGEQLRLQARVYNYSLVDMPAGTQVHVRFYGQVYDNGNLVGNSFLIGEDVIGPIPGFNSTSTNGEAPNWALAGTTFDTTGRANQYLIFWVLVWMLDGNGILVPELEGHGLTQNPAPLTFAQITQVPTEPYSNNVGFYGYNSPFYVAAPDSALAGPPVKEGDLTIDRLSIPTTPILLDGKTKVSAHLRTGDTHLGSLLVAFYDGDPQQGGTVFDIQTIPHLRPNAAYQSRVFFRPQTCGAHTIVVVAGPATAAPDTASTTVDVTIDAVEAVEALIASTTSLALPTQAEARLVSKLAVAKNAFAHAFPRVAVNRLTAFVGEVEVQRGSTLADQQADRLIGQAKQIISCV